MNNSVNYSTFIDLLIASDDDYEPYGLSIQANPVSPGSSEDEYAVDPQLSHSTRQRHGE